MTRFPYRYFLRKCATAPTSYTNRLKAERVRELGPAGLDKGGQFAIVCHFPTLCYKHCKRTGG